MGDGLRNVTLESINNNSDCGDNGYSDFTILSTELSIDQTYTFSATTEYGDQYIKVWIDFNDNFIFENSEVMINNLILGEGQGEGEYTGDEDLSIVAATATVGQHIMRVKTNWNSPVTNDPCEDSAYGETEDYTVDINSTTSSIIGNSISDNDLNVSSLEENKFNFSLTSSTFNGVLIFTVHNSLGQLIVRNQVYKNGDSYQYDLDMSYASPGVYLVRLGNDQGGKVKRIVVK